MNRGFSSPRSNAGFWENHRGEFSMTTFDCSARAFFPTEPSTVTSEVSWWFCLPAKKHCKRRIPPRRFFSGIVIKYGNGTSLINGGLNAQIIYKWRLPHCHAGCPEVTGGMVVAWLRMGRTPWEISSNNGFVKYYYLSHTHTVIE